MITVSSSKFASAYSSSSIDSGHNLKKNATLPSFKKSLSSQANNEDKAKSVPSAELLRSYLIPSNPANKTESKSLDSNKSGSLVAFSGLTSNNIKKAILLGNSGDIPLIKRYDGGYLVDNETETVIYYGEEAKNLLKHQTYFPDDTQVILQSDGKLKATSLNGEIFELFEPGAVLINKNTYAKIDVLKGNPMIITSKRPAKWFTKMSPTNEHRQYFETLADKNNYYYKKCFHKSYLKDEYNALRKEGIVVDYNADYLNFYKYPSIKHFMNELNKTSLSKEQKDKVSKLYVQIQNRDKYPAQNSGDVSRQDFKDCPDWVYDKLCSHRILTRDEKNPDKAVWDSFYKIDELQKELWDKVGIYGSVKDDVVRIWEKTTKSGYDITGLVQAGNGLTIYKHSEKYNQFNSRPTEWITNATEWTEKGSLDIGVSRVISDEVKEARNFNIIRPEEQIHKHENGKNKEEKQTEIYILTQGKAAFCTSNNHKTNLRILEAGDMCVVPPGLEHGIVAIDDEYEHLCCQVPSAFHYGLKFKNIIEPFPKELTEEAITKLKNHS